MAFKNFGQDRPDENGQPTTPTTATGGPPPKRIRVLVNDSTAQFTQEEYEDAVMELKHAYRGDKKKQARTKLYRGDIAETSTFSFFGFSCA